MELSIESTRRRLLVLVVALGTVAVVSWQATTLWFSSHLIASEQAKQVERGAWLVPGNGDAWDRLGRLRQWDLADPDTSRAMAAYQEAIAANPLSAHYWMDLASAYESAGDDQSARQAFLRAREVYPASAEVDFYYGNFLLRRDESSAAYQELHRAVVADSKLLPLVISRAWRANGDVGALLDRVIPADVDAYLQALDFFSSIRATDAGLAVWQRLVNLDAPIILSRTFPFLQELIDEDRARDARQVWRDALGAAGYPNLEPSNGSLIWNGDFKQILADGGLDWRWNNPVGASLDVDTSMAPDQSRALRLDFSGGSNVDLNAPFQYVPVQPGRKYHFRAYLRTEDITTESEIHFQITDPNHASAESVSTDGFTGTHPWTAVGADVETGSDTHFLSVRLVRAPSRLFENKLNGTVWMADVTLVPSSAAESGRPE